MTFFNCFQLKYFYHSPSQKRTPKMEVTKIRRGPTNPRIAQMVAQTVILPRFCTLCFTISDEMLKGIAKTSMMKESGPTSNKKNNTHRHPHTSDATPRTNATIALLSFFSIVTSPFCHNGNIFQRGCQGASRNFCS